MTLRTRRLLLYSLIIIFVVVGVFIAASSAGYIFNVFDGSLERTGGIFIKSQTARITIYLDGTFQKETSRLTGGALLTNISPGIHVIRIEKKGYHPWSKVATVKPTLVTELRDIMLITTPTTHVDSTSAEVTLFTATTTRQQILTLSDDGTLTKKVPRDTPTASSTILINKINSFSVVGNTAFVIQQNGFLTKINTENGDLRIIGRPAFYLSDTTPVRFIPSPQGEIALIDASGGLFVLDHDEQILPISGGIKDIVFDANGEKLLLTKDSSLEVLWRENNSNQPFQKKGTREIIIALGMPIYEAQWFYGDNAHIVFRVDEGIFITEVDGRGGRNTVELISGATNKLFTHPDVPNAIFFKKGEEFFTISL
jgi:hypothetical protein